MNSLDKEAGLGLFWWELAWLPVTPDAEHTEGNNYVEHDWWRLTTQYAAGVRSGARNEQYGGSGVDNQVWLDDNGYACRRCTPGQVFTPSCVELSGTADWFSVVEENTDTRTARIWQEWRWIGKTNALPADGN